MEGSPTGRGTLSDPFVTKGFTVGSPAVSDDDGGTGYNARLIWTAEVTGGVYVQVGGNGGLGTYTLTVSVAPGIPRNFTATAESGGSRLSWDAPVNSGSGIRRYEDRHKQSSSSTWSGWTAILPTHRTACIWPLTNGVSYDFELRAATPAPGPAATATATPDAEASIAACGRSHWDRNKSLATQLLDASCEYEARSRNILADGQVSAQELAEIRPLVRRLREIVDDLPCGSGPHRYYDPAGEQDLYKGPPPECLVRTTKSGGGGLPWEESSLNPNQPDGMGGGSSGGGSGPRQTVPDAPTNLLADGGDAAVTLAWDAPENDDGSEITDYEYRINGRNPWISIGSTDTTHTVTGLVNGTTYTFQVRAVNRIGRSFSSNRAETTPEAPEVFTLDFAP